MRLLLGALLLVSASACGTGAGSNGTSTDDAVAVCASTGIGDATVTASEGGSGGWEFTLDDGTTVNVSGPGKPFVHAGEVGVSADGEPCPSS